MITTLSTISGLAQANNNLSGKITYKVTKEFNPNSNLYQFYQAQYPECFYDEFADEVEYVLEFTKDQGLFYTDTRKITNLSCVDRITTVIGTMSADSYGVYTNGDYYTFGFYSGKNLLIKKPSFDWVITEETKQIQNLTCYKAYYIEKIDPEDKESKINTHTVWFTPELPFRYGPYYYFNAPSLILEANNALGKHTYGAVKIELNIENKKLSDDIKKLEEISEKITLDEYMEM